MSRFTLFVGAVLLLNAAPVSAGWSGWWVTYDDRTPELSPEEVRLQRFWRDYYDALRQYYGSLDNIDWVAYYKNQGQPINCGNCSRIQFAPVFVSPAMQWAVPQGGLPVPGPVTPAGLTKVDSLPLFAPALPAPKAEFDFKAVKFSADEKECTQRLNELTAAGWQCLGPLGNGMTMFRRPAANAVPKIELEKR